MCTLTCVRLCAPAFYIAHTHTYTEHSGSKLSFQMWKNRWSGCRQRWSLITALTVHKQEEKVVKWIENELIEFVHDFIYLFGLIKNEHEIRFHSEFGFEFHFHVHFERVFWPSSFVSLNKLSSFLSLHQISTNSSHCFPSSGCSESNRIEFQLWVELKSEKVFSNGWLNPANANTSQRQNKDKYKFSAVWNKIRREKWSNDVDKIFSTLSHDASFSMCISCAFLFMFAFHSCFETII